MKIKNKVKTILFIFIFIQLFLIVQSFLWITDTPITKFYKEQDNSLDVVYVGGSNVFVHFNSVLAFDEYGFTTGMLSSDSQPFSAVEYLIKESQAYQSPELYIIDIATITRDYKEMNDGAIRKVTDSMQLSSNRKNTIDTMVNYTYGDDSDKIPYYFSFLLYHSKWKEIDNINDEDFELFKGHLLANFTVEVEKQEDFVWNDSLRVELMDDNKIVLEDLLCYLKEENIEVLFIVPPRAFSETEMGGINSAVEIIEKEYDVINFNSFVDEMNIDYSNDFYNFGHLNANGAAKFTKYFSKFLVSNYELDDHRDDNNYDSWILEYRLYKERYYELTGISYDDLLNSIKK